MRSIHAGWHELLSCLGGDTLSPLGVAVTVLRSPSSVLARG
jgi:hypothetical protein